MGIIQWTEKYSVNNKEIDQQHKQWIEIYNSAHDRMLGNEPSIAKKDIGTDALTEMMDYVAFHFKFEEAFMEKIGYPGLEKHRQSHRAFSEKLDRVARQMHLGEYVLNTEVIKIIENWLTQHILKEDKKYGDFA